MLTGHGLRSALACGLVLALLPAAAAARTLTVPDAFTPVLVEFVGNETGPVLGSDGRWHVVYELRLTNARPVPATLERIEVLDYDTPERVIATLEGDALREALHDLASRPAPDPSLAFGAGALAFVALAFDTREQVPDAIVHRLHAQAAPGPASTAPAAVRYLAAPWDLADLTPAVLAAPLRGEGWVVINGCCSARGAHRGAVLPLDGGLHDAQRFAIDWVRLGNDGRFAAGDGAEATDYHAYDQPVFAIAEATVVAVLDGLADQVPGRLPDPSTISVANVDGNHIILDLGGGRYALYAHLKQGTLRVAPGDRVRPGQELARVGNSGNTSAPHLHLHVMNEPSALAADGLPYVFARFTLAGMLDPAQWYAADPDPNAPLRILPGDGHGPRENALPLDLRVVEFK